MLRKYRTKLHAARKAELDKRKGVVRVTMKVRTPEEQKVLDEAKPKAGRPTNEERKRREKALAAKEVAEDAA